MIFFFNLHTSAQSASERHIALKLTLCNASSGSASHLATSHVSKFKGAMERLFRIFLGLHEHFTQRWFKMGGEKVCDGSIECHLNCRRCFHCSARVTIQGTSWFLLLTLLSLAPPSLFLTLSLLSLVLLLSFSPLLSSSSLISLLLSFSRKTPILFLVLISRCHLKVYTVQVSKLPPISVSKFLLFPLFLLHKSSFSQVFPPGKSPRQV